MNEQIANDINQILKLPSELLDGFLKKLKPLNINKGIIF